MRRFILLMLFANPVLPIVAQQVYNSAMPLAHTYSIVGYDPETGEMGVAVQSHWFSVGSIVTWGEAGVGVVATQSFVNPAFGPDGLAMLKKGLSPQAALDSLLAADEGRNVRQVALLNAKGETAVHTGSNCIAEAGHKQGQYFSAQANMMLTDKVWGAMATAFETTKAPLAERLIAALEAAENAGGDIRGKQSAALLVVSGTNTGKPWIDRLVDLRVEDHSQPIAEIKRLLQVHRAYGHMNAGDLAVEKGKMDEAMQEYAAAQKLFPDNEEMSYWTAVTLANAGKTDEALALFKMVFAKNEQWRILTTRIVNNKLLTVDTQTLMRILEVR
ncbi:DUF1028 domain-containing protein [Sphingobacteriales bacterium UPWRP_1]|nr:Zn-dependent protease [Sphingobacteriales bacterium TSM_CSS]PSJ71884.1 DUF1028 domain-containing protein [Sphingobacteriales bacterium UPWRP_1]